MKTLVREDEYTSIGGGWISLYYVLKSTRYSLYVPYSSILVEQFVLDATINYIKSGGYAGLTLEQYLARLY